MAPGGLNDPFLKPLKTSDHSNITDKQIHAAWQLRLVRVEDGAMRRKKDEEAREGEMAGQGGHEYTYGQFM